MGWVCAGRRLPHARLNKRSKNTPGRIGNGLGRTGKRGETRVRRKGTAAIESLEKDDIRDWGGEREGDNTGGRSARESSTEQKKLLVRKGNYDKLEATLKRCRARVQRITESIMARRTEQVKPVEMGPPCRRKSLEIQREIKMLPL